MQRRKSRSPAYPTAEPRQGPPRKLRCEGPHLRSKRVERRLNRVRGSHRHAARDSSYLEISSAVCRKKRASSRRTVLAPIATACANASRILVLSVLIPFGWPGTFYVEGASVVVKARLERAPPRPDRACKKGVSQRSPPNKGEERTSRYWVPQRGTQLRSARP